MFINLLEYLKPEPHRSLMQNIRGITVQKGEDGKMKIAIPGLIEGSAANIPWSYPKKPPGQGGRQDTSQHQNPDSFMQVLVHFPTGDIHHPQYDGHPATPQSVGPLFASNDSPEAPSGDLFGGFDASQFTSMFQSIASSALPSMLASVATNGPGQLTALVQNALQPDLVDLLQSAPSAVMEAALAQTKALNLVASFGTSNPAQIIAAFPTATSQQIASLLSGMVPSNLQTLMTAVDPTTIQTVLNSASTSTLSGMFNAIESSSLSSIFSGVAPQQLTQALGAINTALSDSSTMFGNVFNMLQSNVLKFTRHDKNQGTHETYNGSSGNSQREDRSGNTQEQKSGKSDTYHKDDANIMSDKDVHIQSKGDLYLTAANIYFKSDGKWAGTASTIEFNGTSTLSMLSGAPPTVTPFPWVMGTNGTASAGASKSSSKIQDMSTRMTQLAQNNQSLKQAHDGQQQAAQQQGQQLQQEASALTGTNVG